MALSFAVAATALLLQPASAVPCSAFTSATGLDFDSTVRSPAYPSGLTQPTAAACCGACAATPGCAAYVYEPAQRACFPLASYSGAVPNPDRVIGAALPPCAWSPALPAASLAGCAGGSAAPPCPSRADLASALAACASDAGCGGVTSQAQGAAPWELRAATTPAFSPANATSYYILNGGACRLPSPAPPAPPPTPPSPAGAPPEWQAAIRAGDMLWAPAGDGSVAPDNLPMIGNGFLAQQLMADSLYCAGVFAGHGLEHGSHRARIPSPLAVPAPGPLAGPAALDVRRATYYRRSVLAPHAALCTASSPVSCVNARGPVTVEQRWYAHRALPSLAVMEVVVIASASAAPTGSGPYAVLRLSSTGMAPSADFNFSGVPAPPACGAPGACAAQVGTTQGGTECPPGECGRIVTQPFTVALLSTPLPAVVVVADAAAAAAAPAYFFTVVRTSIETPVAALVEAAGQDFAAAGALAAAGTLHAAHAAEWAETVWGSGFSTDRADAALAVNTSLYSIVSSLRADRPFSTSPGGLANDGYNGHSFWDCETWMWPSLNLLLPDLAASMLDYRVATLPGAYFKATTYSPPYSGASFAWESAVSGIELASAPWGTDELHIGSDIAAAVWAFWVASQDASGPYLNATAWPLMQGIAEFWMSKLALDNAGAAAGAALHLRNVMGPDEYSDHVDDSVYTNAGVIQALTHAAAVGALVGQEPALLAPWLDAAARLTVVYDAAHGYHPESANYSRGVKVKQADTVLLGFPFEFIHATFSPATRAADLAYYANVTDPGGPAMTWGVFAVGLIELGAGFEAAAAANFNRSFANAQPPFDVWTETPTGGTPNFLTGAGGYLQTAFNGYTGLRVNSSGAFFSPVLGEGMGTLGLRGLAYLGNRLSVAYDASSVTVEVAAAAAAAGEAGGARDELAAAGLLPPHPLSLLPRVPLAQRSQRTRVRLGNGHVQPQLPLQLVDAAGAAHALLPGQPLVLPRQPFAIVRAP